MTTKPYFKSVKTRLAFWFLAVSMLSLVTVVTILYFQRSSVIRGREFEKLKVVRDLKVREVSNWLAERTNDLHVLANDPELYSVEGILGKKSGELTERDRGVLSRARSCIGRYVYAYKAYSEIFIVGTTSHRVEISTTSSREGQDKSTYPYFLEPLRTRKPFIQDIYDSKTEGKPAMSFSAPIFCRAHDGEHIVGVIVARADLEHVLYPLLKDPIGEGRTGETLIVNEDVVAVNELRWHDNAPLKLKISAEHAVRAAGGETGIIETKDYRGEKVLAAYTYIPLTKWGFVAKRDLKEMYAPIQAMLRDMALILGASAVVIVVVSMLLSGTICRPILRISQTVQRIAEGDLDARCPVEGSDEIAALGSSINNTAASLASQITIQRGGAEISETMVAAGDLGDFASRLIIKLLDITDSHLGAFYTRSEDDRTFEYVASVGLTEGAAPSFSADAHEGEFGRALATGRISHIRNVPESTVFTFKTTVGTAIPKEIITIPLAVAGKIEAVISLAALGAYSDDHRRILEQAQLGMNTALSNVLAGAAVARLAEKLHAGNEELTAVNEELQAQSEELQQQTEELREQTEELESQRFQVEEANRLKSEFLSNMSHELRTPLNSVMALSQLMLSRGPGKDPGQDAEHLRVIERNGRQLLSLINDILDLSKVESGHMDVVLTDFDPRELVERALATVRPMANEAGLSLEVRVADMGRMHCDEERINQILLNLLSNAVKFTEQGGIVLDVSVAEGMVSYAVTDTGIGISEADIPHVFDEFRQVDGSATRRFEGTGLGLAICQRLAHLLGGEITVESTVGEGSTFTLVLPRKCPETAVKAGNHPVTDGAARSPRLTGEEGTLPTRPRSTAPAREKPLVLIVEDNEVAVLQVRSALEESGYAVTVASSGAEAIERAKAETPDGIILDLMMPEMDGFQVLEEIRSMPLNANTPVLILTAKELTATDRARLTRNNVQQLIQKGDVNRDALVAYVADLLKKPAESPPAAPAAGPVTKEPPAAPSDRSKIVLVVEDNPDNLLTIKAILDNIGCQYITARDGEQAVKAAKESRPGLILMDIQLPGMSGLDAVRRIKVDPVLKGIPIIALTARAMKGDREDILGAGCDGYLSKPLDPADVADMVEKWLGFGEEAS